MTLAAAPRVLPGHQDPLCECHDCKGQRRLADVVDHKEAHRGDEVRFFEVEKLRATAKRCHDRKTGREVQARERHWREGGSNI